MPKINLEITEDTQVRKIQLFALEYFIVYWATINNPGRYNEYQRKELSPLLKGISLGGHIWAVSKDKQEFARQSRQGKANQVS